MSLPSGPLFASLFDQRCQTRRAVAEALALIPAGSRYSALASPLREQYLNALSSSVALDSVSRAAHRLAGWARYERYERAELRLP